MADLTSIFGNNDGDSGDSTGSGQSGMMAGDGDTPGNGNGDNTGEISTGASTDDGSPSDSSISLLGVNDLLSGDGGGSDQSHDTSFG